MSPEIITMLAATFSILGTLWLIYRSLYRSQKEDNRQLRDDMARLENRLDARIDKLENRIDAKIDKLENRIDELRTELKNDIDKFNTRIDELRIELKNDIAKLNTRIDAIHRDLKSDIAKLRTETATLATSFSELKGSMGIIRETFLSRTTPEPARIAEAAPGASP